MTQLSRRVFMSRMAVLGSSLAGLMLGTACSMQLTQAHTLPRIGYLAGVPTYQPALMAGLRDLGYIDGQTIAVESRIVGDNTEANFDALARELVALGVRIIIASSTPAVDAAARASNTIPIVLAGPGPQDIR